MATPAAAASRSSRRPARELAVWPSLGSPPGAPPAPVRRAADWPDEPSTRTSAAPIPTSSADVQPVVWGVTDTLMISKKANPALVKAFIDAIYATKVRTTFDVNEGFLPLLKSQATASEFANDPVASAFIKMFPNARFDPLHPNYSQMQELVKTAVQQALTGTDAKAALDEAATAFNALVAK